MTIYTPEQILSLRYRGVRKRTEQLCAPLSVEDHVPQPMTDVSPPKWHLGHVTWFFEQFVLLPNLPGFAAFDPRYAYLFNSYYNAMGDRVARAERGHLSRPTVAEVLAYRAHVDAAMNQLLLQPLAADVAELIELGLQHEQQHQELLVTDIKYILGTQPLAPVYDPRGLGVLDVAAEHDGTCPPLDDWVDVAAGTVEVGHSGRSFAFDNESPKHAVLLGASQLRRTLVTNQEYLAFMADGGYERHEFWHAEGWDWVRTLIRKAPLYWQPDGCGGGNTIHLPACRLWNAWRLSAMSVTTKHLPFVSGRAGACRPSSNGKPRRPALSGAVAGNGRRVPTCLTRGSGAARAPWANTMANSW